MNESNPHDTEPAQHGPLEERSFGDDPISEITEDYLGRAAFAQRAVELVVAASADSASIVFGLAAPWGSGKTSVLNLIKEPVKEAGWRVVDYNPWEVSDLESLVREFMLTIESVLPKGKRGKRARKAMARYTSKVAPYTSVVSLVGVDPSKAVEAAAKGLEGDTSLSGLRDKLVESLTDLDEPILVLIDDVDRLQGDELTTVLKLVRLVGRLPNVYYVLAFDERTVLDVLQATDVGADDPGRALAYLEKIVQIRLDIPPSHPVNLRKMISTSMDRLAAKFQVEIQGDVLTRLQELYGDHLSRLSEPRTVKRFFNQVEAFFPLVNGEVELIDFMAVTYLRTTYPQVFRSLPLHKRALTGTEISAEKPTPEQIADRWRAFLSDKTSDESAKADALGVLAKLFVPIGRALQRMSPGGFEYGERTRDLRVGSSEYFDRYFYLAVPPDDVSDADIQNLLSRVATDGLSAPVVIDFIKRIGAIAEPAADKLRRFSPQDPTAARKVLLFAGLIQPKMPSDGLLGGARRTVSSWVSELLICADLSDPTQLIELLVETGLPLRELTHATGRAIRAIRADGGEPDAERESFRHALVEHLRSELQSRTAMPLSDSNDVASLIYGWRELDEPNEIRHWLRAAAVVSPWTTLGVASLFVTVLVNTSTGDQRVEGLDVSGLDEMLGIGFAIDNIPDDVLDGAEPGPFPEGPNTFEERVRRATSELMRLREVADTTEAVEAAEDSEPDDDADSNPEASG